MRSTPSRSKRAPEAQITALAYGLLGTLAATAMLIGSFTSGAIGNPLDGLTGGGLLLLLGAIAAATVVDRPTAPTRGTRDSREPVYVITTLGDR